MTTTDYIAADREAISLVQANHARRAPIRIRAEGKARRAKLWEETHRVLSLSIAIWAINTAQMAQQIAPPLAAGLRALLAALALWRFCKGLRTWKEGG